MPSLVGSEMCIRDRCRAGRSGDQDNPLVPTHCRMRVADRDLIRGGHYDQRSCEPHLQAEHMAAPTNAAYVKKVLANSEPSTHGSFETSRDVRSSVAIRGKTDVAWTSSFCSD